MNASLMALAFKLPGNLESSSPCYRPQTWPPRDDWVVSMNVDGTPLSFWGGPVWDFSILAGRSLRLHFSATPWSPDHILSAQNETVLRMAATYMIWGPGSKPAWRTLYSRFKYLKRLIVLCENNRISAQDLWRFPRVLKLIPKEFKDAESRGVILYLLDRLYHGREILGFTIVDAPGIRNLAKIFAATDYPDHEQTAYIPARIWTYQINRLRECLEDFLRSQDSIAACFEFCRAAYERNFGSLAEASLLSSKESEGRGPFALASKSSSRTAESKYIGPFVETAERFDVAWLFEKWVAPENSVFDVRHFSSYFTLIQHVGLAYIGNFTLQRSAELSELRADCLKWEDDPTFGRIPIICGETTKTDPDSDARWPTSPSVELAVEALSTVARLRVSCAAAVPSTGCNESDVANPRLHCRAYEPWTTRRPSDPYSVSPNLASYGTLLQRFPRLFEAEQIRITQEDLEQAKRFTPNLNKNGLFSVGLLWPFAYHELRRTGAVNMFASGLLSESSIQVIMKHVTEFQTRYYGANHSQLTLNREWEEMTVGARYEVMAKQLEAANQERYVSPYGFAWKNQILNLVGTSDFDNLVAQGKKGNIAFREIRLGGCTNRANCEYGGIESISRCAGGDGAKPCRQVLYDKLKRPSAKRQLEAVEKKLRKAEPGSKRARALQAEAQGLRNFLNDTSD